MSFQRVTLESSEKKEWIPVPATRMTGFWDDTLRLLAPDRQCPYSCA
ncbi:hypothetical protein [Wolbachia endosymbiont of Ctenocephalides felis wCfeJ]|nr:hypothetical protein [Wolbachia endosymbiont of Ctenocephalides felis wCfeJ]